MEKHTGNIFHACTLNLIFHPHLLRLGIHLLKKDVDLKEKERGKKPQSAVTVCLAKWERLEE